MNTMKDQRPLTPIPKRMVQNIFSKIYTNPASYVALLTLSFVLLLAFSYSLGYSRGSSFRTSYISTFVISRNIQTSFGRTSDPLEVHHTTLCASPVPPEVARQMIIDQLYNGTSPYKDLNPGSFTPPILPDRIRWGSYGAIYKSLIHKVQPNTIIKLSTFSGASATYMANLTNQLGLETQILCLDGFHGWPGSRNLFEDIAMPTGDNKLLKQFMQNVVSQNATESILPVPISTKLAFEKLCKWGIFADLVEVDAHHDFHSAWFDINNAYKLLRPGGVLFGHNYNTSYHNKGLRQAVRLFARVNRFQVTADGDHWMINSA